MPATRTSERTSAMVAVSISTTANKTLAAKTPAAPAAASYGLSIRLCSTSALTSGR
jgi:hypothetical protein